jgi:predicted transcriptional regulator
MTMIRRTLDIDAATDARLHELAIERGQDVSIVLAEAVALLDSVIDLPDIAEDRRRLDEFNRTGEGIQWDEVKTWTQSWGTPEELPKPKPRKL